MADPDVGQLVASTWEAKVGTKPEDNIHYAHWFLENLRGGKGFKSQDGGRLIEVSLEYAVNTTFKSYSDLETLDSTRIDIFDAAQFNWKEVAGTVVISDKERAFNDAFRYMHNRIAAFTARSLEITSSANSTNAPASPR